ncbi:ABC transporter permease [Cohnella sp. CIP 111063]|jgi:putative aldouronate transport system permease protein|uniref:carbohydrate ABC transporter permease n=1 Tax=unclassified Cohnella TaxID=2636738 RepID=UPI000B8BB698|nr:MULTISPECIES: carbohydrate ABC transporter permease [unclassified Cohnella]OXS53363.1 ABC transporter permease [Cohnella sp. CIP 111063]PRX61108.1 putative aldouronate transport system permease protein [Cohnella sp. SGD-V74]
MGLTRGEKAFSVLNYLFFTVLMIVMIYPFWYMIMGSLSDPIYVADGGFFLKPAGFSLSAYEAVLKNVSILTGFQVTFISTVGGTAIGTFLTATTAYAISKRRLRGRMFFAFLVLFTMLFNGGLVPSYLLIKELNMINTYWALILPAAIGAWNIFVMQSFFRGIPEELEEAAKMDGANDLTVFFRIVLPLSKAVLATIGLFIAVWYWNDFFSSVLYSTDKEMWQLQMVLKDLISNTSNAIAQAGISISYQSEVNEFTIKMASIIVSSVPILLVYPFLQKHFVKGAMIGSVKG